MIKKSFLILGIVFIIQLINSCRCPDPGTFEIYYYNLSVTAWNTAGFYSTQVEDSVMRETFGLQVLVNFYLEQVAEAKYGSSSGFASAFAFSCPDDTYEYADPISNAEIWLTNTETDEQYEVSDFFGTYDYYGNLITLPELFEIREIWHDGFQFDLMRYDSIPERSTFEVKVFLQSGNELTQTTDTIKFY